LFLPNRSKPEVGRFTVTVTSGSHDNSQTSIIIPFLSFLYNNNNKNNKKEENPMSLSSYSFFFSLFYEGGTGEGFNDVDDPNEAACEPLVDIAFGAAEEFARLLAEGGLSIAERVWQMSLNHSP
jgi:hypothetical protein